MWEMANADKKSTKLPVVSWFASKTGKEKHSPRFKVRNDYADKYDSNNLIPVTIAEEPEFVIEPSGLNSKDQTIIINWAKRNHKALLSLWNLEISHAEFLKLIK